MSDNLAGSKIASGPAVMTRLSRVPNSLSMLDEFGLKLSSWCAINASPHLAEIKEHLLTMFSSASEIVNGADYANQKERPREDIYYPNWNVYGTTTASTLWKALSGGDVSSGLLGRVIVVSAREGLTPEQPDAILGGPPDDLVEWVKAAQMAGTDVELDGKALRTPVMIADSEFARKILDDFRKESRARSGKLEASGKGDLAPLWGRAAEHAMKVALLITIASQPLDVMQGGCVSISTADLRASESQPRA